MKNFVEALNKSKSSFKFLQSKFPAVSDAKLGAGVFNGPQIRELTRDSTFDEVLNEAEERTRDLLKIFPLNFLEKNIYQTMKMWFIS